MVSTKQHNPHSNTKDDDSTTVSSNSNNSSNASSTSKSGTEGSGLGQQQQQQQQTSRRNKNRNKRRKEHRQLLKEAVLEEEQLPTSSSAAAARLAVLVLLFVIGALLGINLLPFLLAPTGSLGKHLYFKYSGGDSALGAVPNPSRTYATSSLNNNLTKRPTMDPTTGGELSDATTKGDKHLVEILSSTTIMVYGEKEGTYTYGRSGATKTLSSPSSYHTSSCLGPSCSGAASTIRTHRPSPILCSDGFTRGYDDWRMLRAAIHNLNNYHRSEWNTLQDEWNVHHPNKHGDDNLYYDILQQNGRGSFDIVYSDAIEPFTICPGATLRGRNFRGGGIYVNHPEVVIECDGCTLDMGGTHFRFGGEAKGVTIRGISLMGASTSSLLFDEDGAEVTFEDCTWINNSGLMDDGAVADLNSTSTVLFYRCEISDSKQRPLRFGNSNAFVGSSLIIRNV
jgi:hypothetical protein